MQPKGELPYRSIWCIDFMWQIVWSWKTLQYVQWNDLLWTQYSIIAECLTKSIAIKWSLVSWLSVSCVPVFVVLSTFFRCYPFYAPKFVMKPKDMDVFFVNLILALNLLINKTEAYCLEINVCVHKWCCV